MGEAIAPQEKAHTDVYTWEAVYKDRTTLKEWTYKNGRRLVAARYDDIARDKLVAFKVYDATKLAPGAIPTPVFTLGLEAGSRLIWRKKRRQKVMGPQVPYLTIYLVGWQATLNGVNTHAIMYIYHDERRPDTAQDWLMLSGAKTNNTLLDYELFSFETATPGPAEADTGGN